MVARTAWVLNLDADLELAHGAGYTPTASIARATAAYAEQFRDLFVGKEDLVVDATSPERSAAGLTGRAFCPTPRALGILTRAGANPEAHPSFEVLRRVSSRAFSAALGQTMPGAEFVTRLEQARAVLRGDPAPGTGWRIKRAYGMAGRGHRVVDASPLDADVAFLPSWLADGVQIEPNVRIVDEYALHGTVSRDGSVCLGALTRQRTDTSGAWIGSEAAPEARDVRDAVGREAERAARALALAGYFGPFGVDAFTYDDAGRVVLRARSEINARYSMGFAVGFGER